MKKWKRTWKPVEWVIRFRIAGLGPRVKGFGVASHAQKHLLDVHVRFSRLISASEFYPHGNSHGNPKKGPIKTAVLLKGGYMGFHVSLGEF